MVEPTLTTKSEGRTADPHTLAAAVRDFLDDFSVETTPHAPEEVETLPDLLPAGTRVYVAHPPKSSLEAVIRMTLRLAEAGFRAVPHIIARKLENAGDLSAAAERLSAAGIDDVLVVAGDLDTPRGPFESSQEVLESGLLQANGILSVGVAGHPEGSRQIGTTILRQALEAKARLAEETGLRMRIVSQFGFDPQAVLDWEEAIRSDGIELPVHVGMAGKAPLKQVLRYAIRCGIASSMRMLVSRANSFSHAALLTPVDKLVLAFARHRMDHPGCQLRRAHFFAFGGAARTCRWIAAIRAGRFEIDESGDGLLTDDSLD